MTTLDHAVPFETSADTANFSPNLIEALRRAEEQASTMSFWRDLDQEHRAALRRRFARRTMRPDGLDWQTLAQMDRTWGTDGDS